MVKYLSFLRVKIRPTFVPEEPIDNQKGFLRTFHLLREVFLLPSIQGPFSPRRWRGGINEGKDQTSDEESNYMKGKEMRKINRSGILNCVSKKNAKKLNSFSFSWWCLLWIFCLFVETHSHFFLIFTELCNRINFKNSPKLNSLI